MLLERARLRPGDWTLANLARAIGIQPSYLTNVLNGRADFNPDQLFSLARRLEASEEDIDYLILLLEIERCGLKERREKLQKRLADVRNSKLSTDAHVEAEKVKGSQEQDVEYYLNPFSQLIHVFLNQARFAREPKQLATLLGISDGQLDESLKLLEKHGYIQPTAKGYKVLVGNRHLSKSSPLCRPHQTLLRYKALDQMQRLSEDNKYSFSVTFSSTQEDRDRIQKAFLDFVKSAEGIVKNGKRENVYQINFDLFPWALDG